ncbi:hypothetical protein SLA2020_067170 [Shorea laevis]
MGIKAKKALKKKLEKASAYLLVCLLQPLKGGLAHKLPVEKPLESKATVLYVGHIPHGFYENEMQAYFQQFGTIKRLRIGRNKKTGKSKHFDFLEFEDPQVAEVVPDCMHNYLLFEQLLQVHLVPPEQVRSKLWKGFNYRYKPVEWVQLERNRQNKERTLEEHKKLVERILKQDKKRQKRIEAAGIDYECPEILGSIQPAPKKIKFDE